METKLVWKGRLSFTGTGDSGFPVNLGTDPGVGGDDDGARPMELIALGLAGCTAMDVISILLKKRQQIKDFQVLAHIERAPTHPKVFTHAVIEFLVTGQGVDEEAVRRAIELSADIYCPAQAMLRRVMPIEIKYHIFEGEGIEERRLMTSGEFVSTKPIQ